MSKSPKTTQLVRVAAVAALLALSSLSFGCAFVPLGDAGREPGADGWLPSSPTAVLVAEEHDSLCPPGHGPTLGVSSDLADVDAADFRRRALAQQSIIRAGESSLRGLALAWEAAAPRSDRACTLASLIERVQRRLPRERLAMELSEQSGIRRLVAVRAATAHGADLVPALLTLITHHDPAVRSEAIVALREITDRHPSASGRGPVHAIRVWRAWYESTLRDRAEPRPASPRPPRVLVDRPLAVSM